MAEGECHSLCQPKGTDISQTLNPFNVENRRKCQRYVSIIQGRLDKAFADNDKEKIRWKGYTHQGWKCYIENRQEDAQPVVR